MAIWHSPCTMGIVFALLSPSRKSSRMLLRQTVTTRRSYAYQRCMSTTYGMGRTFKNCRDSGLVVRPRWRLISTVGVRVGASHVSVAEGHCVTARWGGEQPEANPRSVG